MDDDNSKQNEYSGLVGMILGILAVILCWIPLLGLVLAIVSLVFSAKGLKMASIINKGKGFSIAGISCGSVGIVLNFIYTLVWIFAILFAQNTYKAINNEVKDLKKYNYTYNKSYDYDFDDDYSYNSILKNYDL